MTAALRTLAAFVAASLGALASANETCAPPGDFEARGWIQSDGILVVYRTRPAQIEVGRHFTIEAIVCTRGDAVQATGLAVDALMPNHLHGMNYRPRVSAQGDGRYVAEGLLFHMPGRWRLLFDVEVPSGSERMWQDIELE